MKIHVCQKYFGMIIILITGLISTEVYKGKREGGDLYQRKRSSKFCVILKREGGKEGRGGILQMIVIYECLATLDYVFYWFYLEIR